LTALAAHHNWNACTDSYLHQNGFIKCPMSMLFI